MVMFLYRGMAADIPESEAHVPVLDSLNVECDGCDGGGDLAGLELVEDGGLAGGVQPQHEDARLELLRQAIAEAQQPPHGQPHHRLERPVPGDGLNV